FQPVDSAAAGAALQSAAVCRRIVRAPRWSLRAARRRAESCLKHKKPTGCNPWALSECWLLLANGRADGDLDSRCIWLHDARANLPGNGFGLALSDEPLALDGSFLGLIAAYLDHHFLLFVDRLTDRAFHFLGDGFTLVCSAPAAGARIGDTNGYP